MPKRKGPDIIHRWEGNPVISIEDLGFRVSDICNAGAIKVDGEYILLVSIQNLQGYYSIHTARSMDGKRFVVSGGDPFMAPHHEVPDCIYDERGVMDPRITLHEDGTFYIMYDAVGRYGYRLGIARTEDFSKVERLGLISQPDTKCGALFPQKIGGRYARLERPWERGSIWVSYSEDLVYWGDSDVVLQPRGGFWDCDRVGTSCPPTLIDEGWLFIYYGVKQTSAGPLFRLGAAILDKDNPSKLVGRTNVPVLAPRTTLERTGDIPNLVFCCGAIVEDNGEVKVYYGAANSCVCLGTTTVKELVTACFESAKEY